MNRAMRFVCAAAGAACLFAPAAAENGETGWTDTAEFSFVATDGNSESTSFGFKNTAVRGWEKATLTIRASGIRVESEDGDPIAVGTPGSFQVIDPPTSVKTENYALNGRYDREISERLFWFAGVGWDRNEPAGIENRYIAEGGVGNVWRDDERIRFKTNYGVTYTKQDEVDPSPGFDDTFFGARGAWDYLHRLTDTTTYTNVLVVDLNLDETDDWRADMQNGLAVAMSERLSLKVGLQLLYDNEPSFEQLALFDSVGGTQIGTVLARLDELDTIVTASLVMDFE